LIILQVGFLVQLKAVSKLERDDWAYSIGGQISKMLTNTAMKNLLFAAGKESLRAKINYS